MVPQGRRMQQQGLRGEHEPGMWCAYLGLCLNRHVQLLHTQRQLACHFFACGQLHTCLSANNPTGTSRQPACHRLPDHSQHRGLMQLMPGLATR